MKKVVISLAYLVLSTMNNAMTTLVTLPDSETIKKRLEALQLNDLVRVTSIHKKFGGKEYYPVGVYHGTEISIDDYNQYYKDSPKLHDLMQSFAPIIVNTILQDHPEAIKELIEFREKGNYEKNTN
ncbi:hypothetical protein HYX58_02530 [Candidatus Dependentiae bacterium]|nr:hypothetical protein [Candidatus Dependentiae bacterium]